MKDLIEALTIFAKYTDDKYPTCCEHDILYVQVEKEAVAIGDILKLSELGFDIDEDLGIFSSTRFGSC